MIEPESNKYDCLALSSSSPLSLSLKVMVSCELLLGSNCCAIIDETHFCFTRSEVPRQNSNKALFHDAECHFYDGVKENSRVADVRGEEVRPVAYLFALK